MLYCDISWGGDIRFWPYCPVPDTLMCGGGVIYTCVGSPQFLSQTRQGMAMKMENPGGPNLGMRAGMQPGMGGQVPPKTSITSFTVLL